MHAFEKWSVQLRHTPLLKRADWLWSLIRPVYDRAVWRFGSRGLLRVINGADEMVVLPELRGISETYEPETWSRIMSEIRPGDVVVDVGAYIGLYAIAFAKRVGDRGRVIAFEPDPQSFALLKRQIALNGLAERIQPHPAAVTNSDGVAYFATGQSVQSHMTSDDRTGMRVSCCRLDSVLGTGRADILKIDVEGFEEKVLQGAESLLTDQNRKPRAMFIEVHPYNWHLCSTSSYSLVTLLHKHGYSVTDITGKRIDVIDFYGELVARAV